MSKEELKKELSKPLAVAQLLEDQHDVPPE